MRATTLLTLTVTSPRFRTSGKSDFVRGVFSTLYCSAAVEDREARVLYPLLLRAVEDREVAFGVSLSVEEDRLCNAGGCELAAIIVAILQLIRGRRRDGVGSDDSGASRAAGTVWEVMTVLSTAPLRKINPSDVATASSATVWMVTGASTGGVERKSW